MHLAVLLFLKVVNDKLFIKEMKPLEKLLKESVYFQRWFRAEIELKCKEKATV